MKVAENKKYQSKKQKRLFIWTVVAVVLLVAAWNAGTYSRLFGFEPHWVGNNFVFLFPMMIVSMVIVCFTGGLTIINWRQLPNKTINILTVILSFYIISSVIYNSIMLLRQH